MTGPATIEGYLDQLLVALGGRARGVRRVLAEAEAHLEDAAAEGEAAGLTRAEAERQAVERFGPPRDVARRFGRAGALADRRLVAEVMSAAVALTDVGLLAIGASGLVAWGMRATLGDRFVAGDGPGVTYTAARCRDFREYHPEAPTCAAAASAHHADEVSSYRVAAGILGALVAAGAWVWHRRRRRRAPAPALGVLPDGLTAAVAATLFGVVGAGLAVQGLGILVSAGTHAGAGQWLSAAIVSLAVAGAYGVSLLRTLAARTTLA